MLVKIEDTIYKVSWKHILPDGENRGCTRCTIEVIKDMTTNPYVTELVNIVVAFCHSNDQFNKSVGRKYSLRKALKGWGCDILYTLSAEAIKTYDWDLRLKAQRKLFWDAYFKEHKK